MEIRSEIENGAKFGHIFRVVVRDRNGRLKFVEDFHNLYTDEGLTDMLEKYYRGSNYTAAHYVGLLNGTPAATDTMASHGGWTEVTAYSEASRPQIVWSPASNKSINNTANRARFSINANNTTFNGVFICTDPTKGGTTGILVAAGNFTSSRTLADGDTIDVEIVCNSSSA